MIDPGIGFGKRGEQNSEILARLGELRRLLLPILAATSRKSFLSQEEPKALEFATAAAVSAAILHGASIVRVHDVLAMKPVVQTADAIVEATPVPEEKPKPTARPRLDSEVQAEKRSRPVRPPTPPKEKEEQRFPVFPEETRPAGSRPHPNRSGRKRKSDRGGHSRNGLRHRSKTDLRGEGLTRIGLSRVRSPRKARPRDKDVHRIPNLTNGVTVLLRRATKDPAIARTDGRFNVAALPRGLGTTGQGTASRATTSPETARLTTGLAVRLAKPMTAIGSHLTATAATTGRASLFKRPADLTNAPIEGLRLAGLLLVQSLTIAAPDLQVLGTIGATTAPAGLVLRGPEAASVAAAPAVVRSVLGGLLVVGLREVRRSDLSAGSSGRNGYRVRRQRSSG